MNKNLLLAIIAGIPLIFLAGCADSTTTQVMIDDQLSEMATHRTDEPDAVYADMAVAGGPSAQKSAPPPPVAKPADKKAGDRKAEDKKAEDKSNDDKKPAGDKPKGK